MINLSKLPNANPNLCELQLFLLNLQGVLLVVVGEEKLLNRIDFELASVSQWQGEGTSACIRNCAQQTVPLQGNFCSSLVALWVVGLLKGKICFITCKHPS